MSRLYVCVRVMILLRALGGERKGGRVSFFPVICMTSVREDVADDGDVAISEWLKEWKSKFTG